MAFGLDVVSGIVMALQFGRSLAALLFWGAGLFVLPLTLAYTGVVYFIFRGRVRMERGPP